MINNFVGIGRLTKNIELRRTQDGKAVVQFTIAINGYNDHTDFIDCVAWNNNAENMNKYLKKGDMIGVTGRLNKRNYQTQNGQNRYVTEVIANQVQFLNTKQEQPAQNNNEFNFDDDIDF